MIATRKLISHTANFVTMTSGDVLAFGSVQTGEGRTFATVVNFGAAEAAVDLSGVFHETFARALVVVAANGNNAEG